MLLTTITGIINRDWLDELAFYGGPTQIQYGASRFLAIMDNVIILPVAIHAQPKRSRKIRSAMQNGFHMR